VTATGPKRTLTLPGHLARLRRMDDLWGPVVRANWRTTPVICGRAATEADVKAGRAVFHIPTGSVPHQIVLPICGIHRDVETGAATRVVVIQAEEAGGRTMLGARLLEGGNMVCTLAEIEFLTEPDSHFFGA
jgi:hypothetical protein